MISDWPSTTVPSASRAWSVSGVGETGTTWPRTARTRFIRRTPSSKSPPSTAVIAAISRLPTAWPPSPPSGRAAVACPGSGTGGPRSSAARRRPGRRCSCGCRRPAGCPSSLAQHAGRAAVVGDGDDRGQVAGVLLEAAQQRRQAGPAADRHDPRPAGEEPLLVDELDERLVRVGQPERLGQRRGSRGTTPNATRATPTDAGRRSPRSANGRNWRVSRSMSAPARPVGSRSRVTWRRKCASASASSRSPAKTTTQPALDPDARASASAGGSCPVELAVEDRDRPEVLLAQPGRELLGDDDRAVVAAGAADADRQPGLALGDVGREGERRGTRARNARNRRATGWPRTNARTSSVSPDSWRSSAT